MSVDRVVHNAQKELSLNRKWRAKEILSSSIQNYDYSPELYRLYGEILLASNDLMKAAAFLALSKKELSQEEQEAIDIFCDRHGKNSCSVILARIPDCKNTTLTEFPDFVQKRLKSLGYSERQHTIQRQMQNSGKTFLESGGCLILILGAVACFITGFITIIIAIGKYL